MPISVDVDYIGELLVAQVPMYPTWAHERRARMSRYVPGSNHGRRVLHFYATRFEDQVYRLYVGPDRRIEREYELTVDRLLPDPDASTRSEEPEIMFLDDEVVVSHYFDSRQDCYRWAQRFLDELPTVLVAAAL